jgi:WhiB family redox-sensing transcriptional regulator
MTFRRAGAEWCAGALAPLLAAEEDAGRNDPLAWQDQGLCAEIGGDELWFPEKGGSTAAAKRVCRSCPVRSECLEYALANDERFGIWGGLSERERRRVKRGAPVLRRCRKDLHDMTEANRTADGKCQACQNAAERDHRSAAGLAVAA